MLPRAGRLPASFLKSGALKNTLRLPTTAFPIVADADPRKPLNVELLSRCTDKLYAWQQANLSNSDGGAGRGAPFVLHDGPPYANGGLHMGHALNKILKDMVNRTMVMGGRRVDYRPGWDCHGLPIELKALQELREKLDGESSDAGGISTTTKKKKKVGVKESATQAMEMGKRLAPGEIREVARVLAAKTVESQMEGFRGWAVMGDWEGRNFYLGGWKGFQGKLWREANFVWQDKEYEVRQLEVFLEMLKKGLIYRRFKPVYWSPSSSTALAEAELEYNEAHTSTAAFVKFPIVKLGQGLHRQTTLDEDDAPLSAAIWTTTPWTLPANKAIAVNPAMEYVILETAKHGRLLVAQSRVEYLKEILGDPDAEIEADGITGEDFLGTQYRHPLFPVESAQPQPFLSAGFVTSDSGTGLVHCAPGHGMEDYQLCQIHAILPFSPVDNSGKFTDEALPHDPSVLEGKEVLYAGNKAVLELMESAGALMTIQDKYKHKYPYDWRTKQPVIVRSTAQWFADVYSIKDAAINSLKDVTFVPESGRTRLEKMVEGRSEWCISRQRAWGVPIPALYNVETGEPLLTEDSVKHIIGVFAASGGIDSWWDKALPEELFVPPAQQMDGSRWMRGTETMDVWFDSGSSWAMLDAAAERAKEGKPLADLYLEGSDQHRGWFQSSLLTKIAASNTPVIPSPDHPNPKPVAPFGMILTHGFVLDANGKKMSKSLGNIISPQEILTGKYPPLPPGSKKNIYGAGSGGPGMDALRLWVASCDYTKDVHIGEKVLASVGEMLRKVRVTGRFLVGNLEDWDGVEVPYEQLTKIDQYALAQLYKINQQTREAYTNLSFSKASSLLATYTTTSLSAFYLNIIKDRIYSDPTTSLSRRSAQTVLSHILTNYLSLLHPLVPLLTQELWHHNKHSPGGGVLGPAQRGWFSPPKEWDNEVLKNEFVVLEELGRSVNAAIEAAREGGGVRVGLEARVVIGVAEREGGVGGLLLLLGKYRDELAQLFIVSEVEVEVGVSAGQGEGEQPLLTSVKETTLSTTGEKVTVSVMRARGEKCVRCWVYHAREKEGVCERCEEAVLGMAEAGEVVLDV
ncbi:tRNA synthetases class I-domain-containing protein [Peziza echinospora]|nr:tRNA synthetases class I-domain-containing protein [Peziza echinospora]